MNRGSREEQRRVYDWQREREPREQRDVRAGERSEEEARWREFRQDELWREPRRDWHDEPNDDDYSREDEQSRQRPFRSGGYGATPSYGGLMGGAPIGSFGGQQGAGSYRAAYTSYRSGMAQDQHGHERGRYWGHGPKGYTRSDERIREDVCENLTYDSDVDATDISVRVSNGEVTLEGEVEDRHMKRCAEDVAEAVAGVKDVHNRLRARSGIRGLVDKAMDKLDQLTNADQPARQTSSREARS